MARYPAWATGDVLRASYLRDSQPQIIEPTTIQTCDSSNVTGVVDNELFFYAQANASYLVSAHLLFNQVTTNVLLNMVFTAPILNTSVHQSYGSTDTAADFTSRTDTNLSFDASTTFATHSLASDGQDAAVWANALFTTTNFPEFISLKWGPLTAVTGNITRDVGSIMVVTRFA